MDEAISDRELWGVLARALDGVSEGVSIIDNQGKLIYFNTAAERLEELSAEDVIGKHIKEVYSLNEKTSLQLEVLQSGNPIYDAYHRYTTSKGKSLSVIANTFPVYAGDRIVAVVATAKDITLIRELLEKNSKLLEMISEGKSEAASRQKHTFEAIVGKSDVIREAIALARSAARSNSSVLLYGETGTGKELFAQSIHCASQNQAGPFIGINCAAIPETLLEGLLFGTVKGAFTGSQDTSGLFIQAGNGTVFLDEVNSMSLSAQAKLLRVLQEKTVRRVGDWKDIPINCRVISSTNVDPEVAIKNGSLREDLFYRLGTLVISIPPLRERPGDVPVLTSHFLGKYNQLIGRRINRVDDELLKLFTSYHWPGNVRELEHAVESSMNIAGENDQVLMPKHVPRYTLTRLTRPPDAMETELFFADSMVLPDYLRTVEKQVILKALAENDHNISQTAEALGVKRQNLQMRLKKLGVLKNVGPYG